jgi:beta-aspartyl-dipeptidase (metallo-type)
MFLLVENVHAYTPEKVGARDILAAGERIAWTGKGFPARETLPGLEIIDGTGCLLLPGFIDNHVHIIGGGGEGSFRTRTPEITLTDLTTAGVTSVVGVLGTDAVTRHTASLVAKARALEEEGVSAWAMLGSYQLPVRTFTGNIQDDLVTVDKLVGVGEVALSDHRSSQPVKDELARIAAASRVAGMLSGKGGIVNVHMGDGTRGLSMLKAIAAETELALAQFLPTHVNRNPELFSEAIEFARSGGHVDLTTSTTPVFLAEGEVKCSKGLKRLLDGGVPASRVSFSSDGQGSMPDFDENGRFTGLAIGRCASLWGEVVDAVKEEGIPLETALQVITSSPADHYRLPRKGRVAEGLDADFVLVDQETLAIRTVVARGQVMVKDGKPVVFGTFEKHEK